jgi:c-di-GMP-binding flagellar brake protein YcgR
MEEKRKDKRIPINALVIYQIDDYEKMDDRNLIRMDRPISADISLGGLQIVVKQELPVGVYLKIILSIFPLRKTIDVIGKVVWNNADGREKRFRAGIEFVRFSNENDRGQIEEYMSVQEDRGRTENIACAL